MPANTPHKCNYIHNPTYYWHGICCNRLTHVTSMRCLIKKVWIFRDRVAMSQCLQMFSCHITSTAYCDRYRDHCVDSELFQTLTPSRGKPRVGIVMSHVWNHHFVHFAILTHDDNDCLVAQTKFADSLSQFQPQNIVQI